jgi:hypothetical protein
VLTLLYILVAVVVLFIGAVALVERNPITRTVRAWGRVAHLVPPYVESISIGSLVLEHEHDSKDLMKAFGQGLKLYDFEWLDGVVGNWGNPIPGCVEFRRGRPFRFFIRFGLTELQVAFFVKSLPHPFAFGTKELGAWHEAVGNRQKCGMASAALRNRSSPEDGKQKIIPLRFLT